MKKYIAWKITIVCVGLFFLLPILNSGAQDSSRRDQAPNSEGSPVEVRFQYFYKTGKDWQTATESERREFLKKTSRQEKSYEEFQKKIKENQKKSNRELKEKKKADERKLRELKRKREQLAKEKQNEYKKRQQKIKQLKQKRNQQLKKLRSRSSHK